MFSCEWTGDAGVQCRHPASSSGERMCRWHSAAKRIEHFSQLLTGPRLPGQEPSWRELFVLVFAFLCTFVFFQRIQAFSIELSSAPNAWINHYLISVLISLGILLVL